MTTYVALGDSITLGVGDPIRPPGCKLTWRGWAAILAGSLDAGSLDAGSLDAGSPDAGSPDQPVDGSGAGRLAWHNLASNGACAAEVERHQLPRALALRPDLASVIVGINDTLRSGFSPERIYASMSHTVGALRSAGAEVLTVRLPDPGWMFGLPKVLANPLARRMREVNAVVDEVSERYGAIVFDAASEPATYDRRMWAVDRLHPSERGHRMLACRFHDLLSGTGFPVGPRPDPEPSSPPPSRLAEFGWLATKGSAWVLRRSTDLLPALLALAAREALTGGMATIAARPLPPALTGPAPAISDVAGPMPAPSAATGSASVSSAMAGSAPGSSVVAGSAPVPAAAAAGPGTAPASGETGSLTAGALAAREGTEITWPTA